MRSGLFLAQAFTSLRRPLVLSRRAWKESMVEGLISISVVEAMSSSKMVQRNSRGIRKKGGSFAILFLRSEGRR